MSTLAQLFSLALVHFVWQGTLVAILLAVALFAARRRTANTRYVLSCAALAVLLVLPALTMFLLYQSPAPISGVQLASTSAPAAPLPPRDGSWLASLEAWAVPFWCCGVLLFSIRLVWGSRQVSRMRRQGEPAEESLQAAIARLAGRMGLDRRVGVLISDLADGPSVVGLFRPVILLPAATLLGLTPEQLEAVLAHELAHIRRYDYLVNLLQMLAEALLFYHPAVWWISARIRRERELCCDDEAVRACGDSFCYARALTALERLRVMTPRLALGSTDGPLAYRIKRLTGLAADETLPSKLPGLLALCLALALLAVTAHRVRAQVPPDSPGVRVDLGGSTVIHRTPIEYPSATRIQNVQGMITVELHLDEKGNVTDARVLSGPDELRKPVLQSVLGWHFSPGGASTRVISVDFQAPSAQAEKQAAAPPPPPAPLPQSRPGFALTTIPTHGPPMSLPPVVAQRFSGRTLRSIQLRGLSISKEDFLAQAQVPIHEGDTLTQASIEATIAAIKNFDEHLSETWEAVEPNGLELTISAGNFFESGGFQKDARPPADLPHLTPKAAPPPAYPPLAQQARIQGVVKLNATISKEGAVVNLTVISGHPLLVPAAIEAAKQWTYDPTSGNGTQTEIDITFSLSDQ